MEITSSNPSLDWKVIITELVSIIILVGVVALIVLAIQRVSKKSKVMNRSVTNIIMVGVILLAIWIAFGLIGINASYFVPIIIEWTTKFILPWIVLYWFIRLIKTLEKR